MSEGKMSVKLPASLAIGVLLLIGSGAEAQPVGAGHSAPLGNASRLILPNEFSSNSPDSLRIATTERMRLPVLLTPSRRVRAEIKRSSPAGKIANVALAAFIGGAAGFYLGGFARASMTNSEDFDMSVGAPIGAIGGSLLAATYVHQRQRP
jgi:hypothetical protein